MRRQNVEARKAVVEAWEREQQLVKEGKGTRDWSSEQQKDILEKGRAYDENGKAYEGQHMKSAEAYPEYQSEPDNIQLLSRKEHFEAHDYNWRNPTNWYFDPTTKEKTMFGDGLYIPCKVIDLSNPIVDINNTIFTDCENKKNENNTKEIELKEVKEKDGHSHQVHASPKQKDIGKGQSNLNDNSNKSFWGKAIEFLEEFPDKHPVLNGLFWTVGGLLSLGYLGSKMSGDTDENNSLSAEQNTKDVFGKDDFEIIDRNYPETHSSPIEHNVSSHRQRYHTKNGVEWRDKESYPRGGKD